MFTTTMDRKGKLFAYDLRSNKYFWAAPKDVAFIEDYYKLDDRDEGQYIVEIEMAKLESKFAAIHRRILETGQIPKEPEEKGLLLYFISLLSVRNPMVRSSFEESMKDLVRLTTYQAAAHEKVPKPSDYMDEDTLAKMGLTKESDVRDLFEKGLIKVEIKNFYQVETMIKGAKTVYDLLQRRSWYLLLAPRSESDSFITSDNPVVLMSTAKASSPFPPGFAMTDTRVLLPLSRRMLLIGHFDGIREEVFEASPKEIYFYNLFQVSYAFRQVYSPSRTAQIYTREKTPRPFGEYFSQAI